MADFSVKNVSIVGMAACVPNTISENRSLALFGEDGAEEFIKSTGIEGRYIASDGICTSDLCVKATQKLLENLDFDSQLIDCLAFEQQTPGCKLPSTSPLIQ